MKTRLKVMLATLSIALSCLVFAAGSAQAAMPVFQMPFPCGESWHASTYGGHGAIDWNAYPGDAGRPVVASAPGTASVGYQAGGWGHYVLINHGDGWQTRYAHLQSTGVSGSVNKGQVIGHVGSTGDSSAPHLHWEQIYNGIRQNTLYANGSAVNPGVNYNASDPAYVSSNSCTSPPPPSDVDGDGVIDANDVMPTTSGVAINRGAPIWTSRLAGDYNGDGKSDIAALYDYGSSYSVWYLFYGNGNGTFAAPVNAWSSGVGNWSWTNSKPVVGDYNNDGKSDIAVMYHYGSGLTKTFVFSGTASGLTAPTEGWNSGVGQWDWTKTMQVTGDYNGDGKSDIAALYDYGNSLSVWFLFYGTGAGTFAAPVSVWNSGAGNWSWANSKPVSGDYNNDGKSDIAVMFHYGSGLTKTWVFNGTPNGLTAPTVGWDSGLGQWDWTKTMQVTGDFNGDGKSDIATLYDYGNSHSMWYLFYGNGNGTFAAPVNAWNSGVGNWSWANSKPVVGDYNNDGKADIAVMFHYGSGLTKTFVFSGTAGGLTAPAEGWNSGVGQWDWTKSLLP